MSFVVLQDVCPPSAVDVCLSGNFCSRGDPTCPNDILLFRANVLEIFSIVTNDKDEFDVTLRLSVPLWGRPDSVCLMPVEGHTDRLVAMFNSVHLSICRYDCEFADIRTCFLCSFEHLIAPPVSQGVGARKEGYSTAAPPHKENIQCGGVVKSVCNAGGVPRVVGIVGGDTFFFLQFKVDTHTHTHTHTHAHTHKIDEDAENETEEDEWSCRCVQLESDDKVTHQCVWTYPLLEPLNLYSLVDVTPLQQNDHVALLASVCPLWSGCVLLSSEAQLCAASQEAQRIALCGQESHTSIANRGNTLTKKLCVCVIDRTTHTLTPVHIVEALPYNSFMCLSVPISKGGGVCVLSSEFLFLFPPPPYSNTYTHTHTHTHTHTGFDKTSQQIRQIPSCLTNIDTHTHTQTEWAGRGWSRRVIAQSLCHPLLIETAVLCGRKRRRQCDTSMLAALSMFEIYRKGPVKFSFLCPTEPQRARALSLFDQLLREEETAREAARATGGGRAPSVGGVSASGCSFVMQEDTHADTHECVSVWLQHAVVSQLPCGDLLVSQKDTGRMFIACMSGGGDGKIGFIKWQNLTVKLPDRNSSNTHTHTHTHTYI
eukprot:GHVR01043892.1.p1 GENE.GHVR01043892.1~~GHVR01043892.1.p1  ORF type:complete len:597 (+),score=233.88 GHVR01043892.1:70-1860(+)